MQKKCLRKLANHCKLEPPLITYTTIDSRCNTSVRAKIFKYYKKMEVLHNSAMESLSGSDTKDSTKKEN